MRGSVIVAGRVGRTDKLLYFVERIKRQGRSECVFFFFSADAKLEGGWGDRHAVYGICGEPRREV